MYEKTIWYDHATEPANCFAVTDNGDGTKTIVRAGTVLQQGTAVSAEHLNHMEDGIAAAAEKVLGAAAGNFAGLDADGNLLDSGKKADDFANAIHGHGIVEISGMIGGDNLLSNSAFIKDTTGWTLSSNVTRDPSRKLAGAVSIKNQQSGLGSDMYRALQTPQADYLPCSVGDILAISAYVYIEDYTTFDSTLIVQITVRNASNVDVQVGQVVLTPTAEHNGKWVRLTRTLTVTAADGVKFGFYSAIRRNGTAWFAKPKIERGNIATDWSPSWADLMAVNPAMLTLCDAWLTPTLLNGWTEFGGLPVRYCKDALGWVRFKGRINTAAIDTVIMNLPAGYRPLATNMFAVPRGDSATNIAKVYVNSGGDMVCNTTISPASWIDIATVCYRAEA